MLFHLPTIPNRNRRYYDHIIVATPKSSLLSFYSSFLYARQYLQRNQRPTLPKNPYKQIFSPSWPHTRASPRVAIAHRGIVHRRRSFPFMLCRCCPVVVSSEGTSFLGWAPLGESSGSGSMREAPMLLFGWMKPNPHQGHQPRVRVTTEAGPAFRVSPRHEGPDTCRHSGQHRGRWLSSMSLSVVIIITTSRRRRFPLDTAVVPPLRGPGAGS